MSDEEFPLLSELKKGPWPSFVKEIEKTVEQKPEIKDLLKQLERSYEDKITYWKHGGIVSVKGYGGGVIGRYSFLAKECPGIAEFHTMRVNQPSGYFYTTEALRKICDIWDEYGSGLTNMHGSTGDIILLGTPTKNLQPCFNALAKAGFDLGGSGSALRTPNACVGPARCEFALFDTLALCYDLTMTYQDELHRPMWPYKFKFKISGCPNDCVAAKARSDFAIIGTWKDEIKIDQEQVKKYVEEGVDIQKQVVEHCPTKCIEFDEEKKELKIDNENCVRCMHCINVLPKALRPGDVRGACILLGGKAPILEGPVIGWLIVPFIPADELADTVKDLAEKVWDWWDENGKYRERVAELVERMGMMNFLEAVGLEPDPRMIKHPRENPFFFWREEDLKPRVDPWKIWREAEKALEE
ncbi:dissimilatory-type sulfite reductase subunit alpha [Archaeoglobales archaeon]|nr:MAG: dissimilatory-type sulfite reductase subunit alpha [Archaeoglobales archaeon]